MKSVAAELLEASWECYGEEDEDFYLGLAVELELCWVWFR